MSPRPQSATTTPLRPHRQHPPLGVTPLLCGVLLLHPLYKSCTASSAYLKSAQHSWCGPVTPSCLGGWGGEREDTSLQLCAIPQSSACGGHEDRGVPGARGHPLAGSPPVLHPLDELPMANWCPMCPCVTYATPKDGSMRPQEGCVTSLCVTVAIHGLWPCVSPDSHSAWLRVPVCDSAHTCPQPFVSPQGSHPAASAMPLCYLCRQGHGGIPGSHLQGYDKSPPGLCAWRPR